jgi:hypothetical protein
MSLGAHRHGAVPAPLSRAGCSRQFGRASAPMMPHRVHTMRGPNVGPVARHAHLGDTVCRGGNDAAGASVCVVKLLFEPRPQLLDPIPRQHFERRVIY